MNDLKFEISQVHAGWFVCLIGDAEVCASNVCGHDGPRQLLKLLAELLSGEREEGCAVFEEEPGTYILSIKRGTQDQLTLLYTKKNLLGWYPLTVGEHRILTELPRNLKIEEQLLLVEDLDLYSFACTVGDAFSAYIPKKMRDKYIGNWMAFPMEELAELRHALGDYSENLNIMTD
ncbi:MAG: hypothetical protein IJY40_02795 [Oscillospiraceae bacterium]|nr:hypothetical protein [Oscillospiraceae bacterium]